MSADQNQEKLKAFIVYLNQFLTEKGFRYPPTRNMHVSHHDIKNRVTMICYYNNIKHDIDIRKRTDKIFFELKVSMLLIKIKIYFFIILE
jgi:hypothetical protein